MAQFATTQRNGKPCPEGAKTPSPGDAKWRSQARRQRDKLLEIDLNPDIPLEIYTACHNMRFYWNLSPAQRIELGLALAEGDAATAMKLQQASNFRTGETAQALHDVLTSFLDVTRSTDEAVGGN